MPIDDTEGTWQVVECLLEVPLREYTKHDAPPIVEAGKPVREDMPGWLLEMNFDPKARMLTITGKMKPGGYLPKLTWIVPVEHVKLMAKPAEAPSPPQAGQRGEGV